MKKLIFILIGCLLIIPVKAQFSFGIKAGFNQNGVYTRHKTDYDYYQSILGFHVGLYSQFPLTNKWSLNPELQYIKKGPENFQYFNLNYLEIPILFNYTVWKSLSIEAGPTIGAPVFGRQHNHNTRSWIDMDISESSLDAGFVAGFKYQLAKKVSLVARYNQSVLPFDYYGYANFESGKAYLKNVQFSVMYKLK